MSHADFYSYLYETMISTLDSFQLKTFQTIDIFRIEDLLPKYIDGTILQDRCEIKEKVAVFYK